MSDFQARKATRITDAAAGAKFRFAVVSNHYAFPSEEVGSFDSRQSAADFIAQIGPIVGNCQALHVFSARHRNSYIPSGMSFKIVREKVLPACEHTDNG